MSEHESPDLSLDEFRSQAARDDDPDAHDVLAAEESLHQVDPFVDPELLEGVETLDVDAIAREVAERKRDGTATTADGDDDGELDETDDVDHEASVDEILDETTHSHDPAREVGWADTDDNESDGTGNESAPAVRDELPEPRHNGEFNCAGCFLVLPDRLRSATDSTRCQECAPVG